MQLQQQHAREVGRKIKHTNIILTGDSGTGKTRAGSLMPDPVILELEPQAMVTVCAWNPDAVVIPCYVDDEQGTFTGVPGGPMTNPKHRIAMVDLMFEAVMAGRPQVDGGLLVPSFRVSKSKQSIEALDWDHALLVRSLVLDSATEWQRLQLEALLGRQVAGLGDDEIPGKVWNTLKDSTLGLFRRMRDLPVHTMVLGLLEDKETRGGLKAMMAFYGRKVGPAVAQFANAVGILVKRDGGSNGIEYGVIFEGASELGITKACAGLRAFEPLPKDPRDGGPALWVQAILDSQPGAELNQPDEDPNFGLEAARAVMAQRRLESLAPLKKEAGGGAVLRTAGGVRSRGEVQSAPVPPAAETAPVPAPAVAPSGGVRGRVKRG